MNANMWIFLATMIGGTIAVGIGWWKYGRRKLKKGKGRAMTIPELDRYFRNGQHRKTGS